MRAATTALLLAGLALPWRVDANMCEKSEITDRYRTEARLMKSQTFAPASPDYRGDDEYNAWILACNRDRDNRGKELDRLIDPANGGGFARNLPSAAVKGQYSFYGNSVGANVFTSLEYRYLLRRVNGEWIVTLPIKLNLPGEVRAANLPTSLPQAVVTNRLDIAQRLAVDLGLMSEDGNGSKECDRGRERFTTTPWGARIVSIGFIGSPANPTYDGIACRLPMNRVLPGGKTLLSAFFEFWKGAIETAWARPGFRVEVVIVDHDPITDSQMKSFERDDLIWTIHTTLSPDQRPRYRSAFASLPHFYTGAYPDTIAHEAGHELGLDDEYREDDKGGKNAWRDCDDPAQGGMGGMYLMCQAASVSDNDADDFWTVSFALTNLESVKGIYPWIITRRYAVADAEQCFADADCKVSQYCNTGSIGRNECLSRKAENDNCSADHQCRTGAICQGKPLGKCITEASVRLGGKCSKNQQCETLNCSAKGICQCANDADCSSTQYCRLGTLDIGSNDCTVRKTEGDNCSEDRQCAAPAMCSGKPLGKCVTAASVSLGGSCARDVQCKTGSCDNNGVCQCNDDGDCGSGASCDKGTLDLGRNICVSNTPTASLGDACIRSSQCLSGSCSSKGVCQCNNDGDCGSGMWCNAGIDVQANACRAKLASGQVCGVVGDLDVGHRCRSGSCKVSGLSANLKCK